MEQKPNILGMSKRYLWTSQELLDPEVGAVEIGLLEAGKYKELKEKMIKEAGDKGINKPLLVVDLIIVKAKSHSLGLMVSLTRFQKTNGKLSLSKRLNTAVSKFPRYIL